MLTLAQMKTRYKKAKLAYSEQDKLLMTDAQFDALEDTIRSHDATWPELRKTGVAVKKHKAAVALTSFMPSLNKVYPEDLAAWQAKNPGRMIWMDKIDGTSLQLVVVGGKPVALHTRGDGAIGKDVTHLLPHTTLPTRFGKLTAVFRLEGVMPKAVYAKKWAQEFDNARQAANGIFNRKEPHPALTDIHLVVLGVYGLTLTEGFNLAVTHGMTVVAGGVLRNEDVSKGLESRRVQSPYEVDGLVLAQTSFVLDYLENEKPKSGIVAFKINSEEDKVTATVKQIVWQVTSRGRIIPKIEIEPTRIGGVMVKHAAAHNAQMMTEKGIGPGAVVRLIRSGGVIPYIDSVVKKGKFQAPDIPYTQEGVHFVVAEASRITASRIDVLNMVKFLNTLGIEGLKEAGLTKLHNVGLALPKDFVYAWHRKALRGLVANTVGIAASVAVVKEFDRVFTKPVHLRKLLVALQVYGVGIGERKLSMIEAAGHKLSLLLSRAGLAKMELQGVRGYDDKSFALLKEGRASAVWGVDAMLASGVKFTDALPEVKAKSVGGKLAGNRISFTGYRDKEQEAAITAAGGEVVPFGGSTQILLYKEGGKASGKVEKAHSKGIGTMTYEQLMRGASRRI